MIGLVCLGRSQLHYREQSRNIVYLSETTVTSQQRREATLDVIISVAPWEARV